MKIILVTGGNKGIGKALCRKILENDSEAFVYLCSRDSSRGCEAVASIVDDLGETATKRIECLEMDVADVGSVMVASQKIAAIHPPGSLYGIVNNAGVGKGRSTEEVMSVNYFGPKNVTLAFLPLLNPSGGRIVNISSDLGPAFVQKLPLSEQSLYTAPGVTSHMIERKIQEAIDSKSFGDDQEDKDAGLHKSYGFSKACLNVLTCDFADLHSSLLVNACIPGFIKTDMTEGKGATNPPEMGTLASMHCLFGGGDEVGSGNLFGSDGVRSPLDRYRAPGEMSEIVQLVKESFLSDTSVVLHFSHMLICAHVDRKPSIHGVDAWLKHVSCTTV